MKVGLYRWRARSSRRRTKWHLYERTRTTAGPGHLGFRCGLLAFDVPGDELETRVVDVVLGLSEHVAGVGRIVARDGGFYPLGDLAVGVCGGCLHDLGLELLEEALRAESRKTRA